MPQITPPKERDYPFFNKEMSWLSFNARVLQEAEDQRNPLGERMKFMGIYSSNLDEFFRVRVAMIRRLCRMGQEGANILKEDPAEALLNIQKEVGIQRKRFNTTLKKLYKEMSEHGIQLLDDHNLNEEQIAFSKEYFEREVRHKIFPIMIDKRYKLPEMKDKTLYLAVELKRTVRKEVKTSYSIIEIPTKVLPRFIKLPEEGEGQKIILIDEIVRIGLPSIFRDSHYHSFRAWNFKVVRDSELDIDENDDSLSYMSKINQSIQRRKLGDIIWFLYDVDMNEDLFNMFLKKMRFRKHDTVTPGGRYHYFSDFIRFPKMVNLPCCENDSPLKHRHFPQGVRIFPAIRAKDTLLYFPYHSFDTVIDLLREASIDPRVESIKVTLYRVANYSSVANALINARKNRKEVLVIMELQARFDEENNIYWANLLKENDVQVIFGVEGLKVHSKLLLISRREKGKINRYGGIGTGNLNEDTARIYTDCFLLTAHKEILEEVDALFDFFENNYRHRGTKHLLISPYGLRSGLTELIDNEIKWAQQGEKASIRIKLNNLSDEGIIQKLYEASQAGVSVKIIVRGRFSLVPGIEGFSENIKAISILDRYLEHARFFIFRNGGDNKCFISSADWLGRNIDRRVEVTCPIYRKSIKQELKSIFDIQWADNTKARILDKDLKNEYVIQKEGDESVRSQDSVYTYLIQKTARS
ncbi:polyphosphate kinase 1 [Oceanispirochaeta crateris]|uniref:Polyphosphate kinase n=1 Tax=Oceanispirochaeta crateris TaxID=2518645 RepID=A0A5C1QFU5_9SPIO|nr:polyphosphate kinase 1 [Oceanispirochaeta crateris]QEN07033.1 polyphosphate kinase 1 [Oceanispirochaeta crateris]